MSPDKNTDPADHLAPLRRESLGVRTRQWIGEFPIRFVVIVVASLLLIGLIYFLSQNQPAQKRGRFGEAQPVGIARVTRGSMPITLNALGTVTPLATVTVRPQVSGPVVRNPPPCSKGIRP